MVFVAMKKTLKIFKSEYYVQKFPMVVACGCGQILQISLIITKNICNLALHMKNVPRHILLQNQCQLKIILVNLAESWEVEKYLIKNDQKC
jgi:hypothetical protein